MSGQGINLPQFFSQFRDEGTVMMEALEQSVFDLMYFSSEKAFVVRGSFPLRVPLSGGLGSQPTKMAVDGGLKFLKPAPEHELDAVLADDPACMLGLLKGQAPADIGDEALLLLEGGDPPPQLFHTHNSNSRAGQPLVQNLL
jgi:hypothetical protein